MTQNEMILDHLTTHPNGITPREAEDRFGCMRLASRISDLRDMGHNISKEWETHKNRFGRRVTYARYKLVVDGDKTGNP